MSDIIWIFVFGMWVGAMIVWGLWYWDVRDWRAEATEREMLLSAREAENSRYRKLLRKWKGIPDENDSSVV